MFLMLGAYKNKYKKAKKRLLSLCLSYYLPGNFNEKSVLILTSSPRSGSTLLGQVLDEIPDTCPLFEPLQLTYVPEAKQAGFSWRTYVHPMTNWNEGFSFFKRIFEGRVINRWTSIEMSFIKAISAKRMVIKFVRANRILPWLCQNFALCPPILLLRHPCAVVASQISYGEIWQNIERPEIPNYIKDFPRFIKIIEEANSELEFLTIIWVLDQLPPLLTPHPTPWFIVTYEELVLRPEQTIARITDKWDVEINVDNALLKLKKPSMVVSKSGISGVDGWKKKLSQEQISTILNIVESFGLSFYSNRDEADYERLHAVTLASHIKQLGKL